MKIKNLMLKNLKETELQILNIYNLLKKEIPNFNRLTFEVAELSTGLSVCGFYHIGGGCQSYESVAELDSLLSEVINRRAENETRVVESYDESEDGGLL